MSELAFTLARIGFLVLLWVFVLLTIRALRRDVADTATPGARLIITEGPLAGSTVPLSPTSISIGRSPSCTLVLEDSYASSRHARIFPKDGTWWLEDLGSTNGTTLAGHPVHGTVELPMGVPVRIGQTTL